MGSYSFSPASRNYTNVTAHQSAQDYATVTVQVSGTATTGALALEGVAFAATNNGAAGCGARGARLRPNRLTDPLRDRPPGSGPLARLTAG